MSLFGSLITDMDDDPFYMSHLRTMRQLNNVISSVFGDTYDSMGMNNFRPPIPALTFGGRSPHPHTTMMPFVGGFAPMSNINRLISNSLDNLGDSHSSYSSSTVVSMSSGPDGRPHVYKATSSTRTAPGGVCETQKTVCDSRSGTKKMSIGHHIGERAHIIEREQNVHSGDQEERQDFINLDEDEADDFNKEWESKTSRVRSEIPHITANTSLRNRHGYGHGREHSGIPAITAGPSSISVARHPYMVPRHSLPKKSKNVKTVSGSPSTDI